MTTVVVSLVAFVMLLVAAFVFVGWRDRHRLSSPEDSAAARDARSEQERAAVERHGLQGHRIRRDQTGNGM
ncbi:hypothetical protein [Micromonospora sp. SL4-19]|uniref:hypothetical protein n=1 Tax=Micromonospora sp. SL4-19 TaxID=3399129 RepID=UPI003A4DBD3D